MRKNWCLALGIAFLLVFVSQSAFAGWEQMTPSVVGGSLTARNGMRMAPVTKDKILMFGGNNGPYLAETWLYDSSDNRWTKLSPLVTGGALGARRYQGMSYIGGDRVLMFGGEYGTNAFRGDTWLFDLSENKWTLLNPIIEGAGWTTRGKVSTAYIGDDKVLMFGGFKYNSNLDDTWLFDLSENKWRLMNPTVAGGILTARRSYSLSYIADGKVLMFGGYDGTSRLDETWIYDLAANTWTPLAPVVVGGALSAKNYSSMTFIGGDKIIMFGGEIASNYTSDNDTWLFDLSDNTWTMLSSNSGPTPSPRCIYGMAAVGSGKVTIFGGYNSGTQLNDTWTYQMDNFGAATVKATPATGGIEVSWSVPTDVTGLSFIVYKNGQPLSTTPIQTGTVQGDNTVFTYFDDTAVSGTLNRYKVLERFPLMNSEVFYPEVTVPYCP